MDYKKVKDHLDNEFNSVKEMIEYYNLDYGIYYNRRKLGWSLEKILTTKRLTTGRASEKYEKNFYKKYYDHLGNEYNTLKKMCDCYGIDQTSYIWRINHDWPLKYALTVPTGFSIIDAFKKIEELEARINQIDVHRTARE